MSGDFGPLNIRFYTAEIPFATGLLRKPRKFAWQQPGDTPMPKTHATIPPIALPHAPSAGAAMQAPSLGGTALVVSDEHAARMLSLAPRTLQSLRLEGGGPPHVALTSRRVGYLVSELEAWARQRSRTSTSAALRAERGAQ